MKRDEKVGMVVIFKKDGYGGAQAGDVGVITQADGDGCPEVAIVGKDCQYFQNKKHLRLFWDPEKGLKE